MEFHFFWLPNLSPDNTVKIEKNTNEVQFLIFFLHHFYTILHMLEVVWLQSLLGKAVCLNLKNYKHIVVGQVHGFQRHHGTNLFPDRSKNFTFQKIMSNFLILNGWIQSASTTTLKLLKDSGNLTTRDIYITHAKSLCCRIFNLFCE
ncbi:hypothetical protein ACJX0J_018951, partial [Zea mays]